jgi:hypothetical protein
MNSTTYSPQFTASRAEMELITAIAKRAVAKAIEYDVDYEMLDAEMDLTACHANGCPLDLPKLLAAPDGDFGHDVYGIRRFIDRSTGKLMECFVPRCAARQP